MKKESINFMTRTAVMLAITLVFQAIRFILPAGDYVSYIISTLVNLALIVAASCVNVWSGLIIAVLAPIVAYFQGHAQLPLVPPIILGNACVVLGAAWGFAKGKDGKLGKLWIAYLACPVKYAVIAVGMALLVLVGVQGMPFAAALPVAFTKQLVQLITAALGVTIAIPVVKGVRRAIDK